MIKWHVGSRYVLRNGKIATLLSVESSIYKMKISGRGDFYFVLETGRCLGFYNKDMPHDVIYEYGDSVNKVHKNAKFIKAFVDGMTVEAQVDYSYEWITVGKLETFDDPVFIQFRIVVAEIEVGDTVITDDVTRIPVKVLAKFEWEGIQQRVLSPVDKYSRFTIKSVVFLHKVED